ncbi:MAG TPA: hypothetical protein ENF64_01110, partial [Hadesarchaea archaeon]|nr:hypothetical protein [Hadesarchaea archaeon]
MKNIDYRVWFRTFSLVNKIFQENGIDHVFIKMLLNPFHMRDVDVLIPKLSDEKLAIELLKKAGFRPYRAGRLLNPWKIICEGEHISHLSVDIHPTAEWNRTIVGDGVEIAARKIVAEVGKTKAFLPAPEDSFYLIATHAFYQHMTISRPEVQNGITLLSTPNFSWDLLRGVAERYGTAESIYAFLLAINLERPGLVGKSILNAFSRGSPGALVGRWFENTEKKFPLIVPKWLGCVFPSYNHTKTLIGKVTPKD